MISQKLIALVAVTLVLAGCSKSETPPPPPPPVTVAAPVTRDVVDWDEYVGRFEAPQSVEVRPRTTGYLSAIHFRDGQYVSKGQLLFTVDSRPAQAAQAQARAQLAQAQAVYANAKTELARTQTLAAARAASQEELEARQATLRSGAAQVAAAQAVLDARTLDVGFTRVTAPISGRISDRRITPGNSVTADQTVLTTIVSTDPLYFTFQGSEASLLKYQRSGSAGQGTKVRVRLADEGSYNRTGTLDFIDNVIDASAGTIRARAIIPNGDGFLKPGMFGNLRLEASKAYPALLVPDVSIIADASRRVVYVVAKDGTVEARTVEVGPLMDGLRVIRSGVKRDDRVIIGGIQRARPGQKVTPQQGKIEAGAKDDGSLAAAPPPSAIAEPASGR